MTPHSDGEAKGNGEAKGKTEISDASIWLFNRYKYIMKTTTTIKSNNSVKIVNALAKVNSSM